MQPQLDEYKPSGPPGHKRSNLNKRSGFDVFTVQGYSDWKRDLLNQSGHVENIINVHINEEREKNRLRLKVLVAALVKLLAEFNPEVEKVVMENAPVRKHIRDEIGDSKFSIIVDETCDVAKREQMALVLRFVDGAGVLQERFFDVIHVKNTKAITLKDELCSVLRNHSLDIKNLRGQGYDGSSNMKGELNGLQALFLRECPYAYYVHCYAHRLQLALVAVSNDVVPVCQFFQKLLFIVNIVDSSAKRHDEL
ncbi:uncharacterized protein LOC141819003 [Curcuma longa]|uniref:uncharacterized protein LOC141819003 n=1 Tax=Curcuma longa TaxID=136217 RepID=UPI003D9F0F11